MTKFLIHDHKAINVNHLDDFYADFNYLKLTTSGGLNAREIQFLYGSISAIEKLFDAIVEFIQNDEKVFDCDKFLKEHENA